MPRSIIRALIPALAALCVLAAAPARADAVTVTTCTAEAFDDALAAAPAGATIEFGCDGTIVSTATRVLAKDVTIDGAGHDVVLDGDAQHQLFAINGGVAVTLRDLTLTNGLSQGSFGGGAIYSLGQLVVDRVRFLDNQGFDYGGAIYSRGPATLEVIDSLFEGNTVTCPNEGQGGGAIAVQMTAPLVVRGSTFRANVAAGGASGGAILGMHSNHPAATGPIDIADSVFEANEANSDRPNYVPGMHSGGGAVAVYNHALTIDGSDFVGNSASTWGGPAVGGAVYVSPSTAPLDAKPAAITDSLFLDNVAWGDDSGDPDRLGSWGLGGALATLDQPVTVADSQFLGNTASHGGAILQLSGELALTDSIVQENLVQTGTPAGVGAGGLELWGTTTVAGSLVLDNEHVNCLAHSDEDRTGRVVDGGGNLEQPGDSCGFAPAPGPDPAPTPWVPVPDPGPVSAPLVPDAAPSAPQPPAVAAPSSPAQPRTAAARALGRRAVAAHLRLGGCRAFVPAGRHRALPARRDLLRLAVVCPAPARVAVRARVDLGGERHLALDGARLTLAAHEAQVVELRLSRDQRRALRRAEAPRLRVAVTVDGATHATREWPVG